MNTPAPVTVSRAVAASMLWIGHGTLRNWASAKPPRGPRPTKTGTSKQARTLYEVADIKRWKRDPVAYEAGKRRSKRAPRR